MKLASRISTASSICRVRRSVKIVNPIISISFGNFNVYFGREIRLTWKVCWSICTMYNVDSTCSMEKQIEICAWLLITFLIWFGRCQLRPHTHDSTMHPNAPADVKPMARLPITDSKPPKTINVNRSPFAYFCNKCAVIGKQGTFKAQLISVVKPLYGLYTIYYMRIFLLFFRSDIFWARC